MCKAFNEYIKGTTGSIRSFGDLVKSKEKVFGLESVRKINHLEDIILMQILNMYYLNIYLIMLKI